MLERSAPLCIEACPGLCSAAVPLLAAQGGSESELHGAMCASSAELSCALDAANAEACSPLLEAVAKMPRTPEALATMCQAQGGNSSSLFELSTEVSVESARGSYLNDPRCRHAPEGQLCVPKQGGHSDSYIYCSAHRRISPRETYCPSQRGPKSWCVGGGVGLTKNYCDDPFCRNGGAYAGSGTYCHGKAVVSCHGQEAPKTVQYCADQTHYYGNQQVTDHYDCFGGHNHAHCVFSYSSTSTNYR